MNRIFIPDKISIGKTIQLMDQTNYLLNVLRFNLGSKILVFNGSDGEHLAEINEIQKKYVIINIKEKIRAQEFLKELNVYISIIKQDKMMLAVDLAVQLGATSIQPIVTDYTQYKNINHVKFEKRIIETIEQSNRLDKVILKQTMNFQYFIKNNNEKIIWTNVKENKKTMNDININLFNNILIGPEGGFSENENKLMIQDPNFESIKISKTILRSETAIACSIGQFNLLSHRLI